MVSCSVCNQPFNSQIELSLHISHEHRGQSVAQPKKEFQFAKEWKSPEASKAQIEEHESGPEYALATSKEGLGELCPVLYAIINGKEEIVAVKSTEQKMKENLEQDVEAAQLRAELASMTEAF